VPPCDSSWTTGPITTTGWPGSSGTYSGLTLQTEVRIGAHPGFDRFVVEFEASGAPPGGWAVHWLSGIPVHDGSGMPVAVGGNEFLQVVYLGSAGWAMEDPADWYSGPTEFFGADIGAGNLVEAEDAGDFEGYVTWALGFDHQAPFTVFALTGPPRLVVDVCH